MALYRYIAFQDVVFRNDLGLGEGSWEDPVVRDVERARRANRVGWDRSSRYRYLQFGPYRFFQPNVPHVSNVRLFCRAIDLVSRFVKLIPSGNCVGVVVHHGVGRVMEQGPTTYSFVGAYLRVFSAAVDVVGVVVAVVAVYKYWSMCAVRYRLYVVCVFGNVVAKGYHEEVYVRPVDDAQGGRR